MSDAEATSFSSAGALPVGKLVVDPQLLATSATGGSTELTADVAQQALN